MLSFRKKKLNFLIYFLVIFSVFSQNQKDQFDFLDKIDSLKKKETLKVEEKKSTQIKKAKLVQVKRKSEIKKKKVVQKQVKKPIVKESFSWIDEKVTLSPDFEEFGFQIISSNKNIVQNKKDTYQEKEPILEISDSAEKMIITNLWMTKFTELKENFELIDIVNGIIEYKKAIIIFLLIIFFAFLRNKYIMKSPKSMMVDKKTVISNKFLNKRKY